MLINYWDCKYNDYREFYDGRDEIRYYGCTHPTKKDSFDMPRCLCSNKWSNTEDDCPIAEKIKS